VADPSVTANPDDAVGATVSGPLANVWFPGELNVIVCAALPTVIHADPVLERNDVEPS
jgi:hypothetical protein